MNKELSPITRFPAVSVLHDVSEITADYYVKEYKSFLFRYIANGRPTSDTLTNYYASIDQFIAWCASVDRHPLKLTESDLIIYRDWLQNIRKLKDSSVKAKIMAVRKFYYTAIKYGLISQNPAADVKINIRDYNMEMEIKYLTQEQVHDLFKTIYHEQADFGELKLHRDAAMLALMVVEGCRTIEIHRLSEEDINWELQTILIKGKNRNDFIYPSPETMNLLKKYLNEKKKNTPTDYRSTEILTPLFVNLSRNAAYCRISRRGIRWVVDILFTKMRIKKTGMSAHTLRHTCGTLAYTALKDLLAVKEILRHKDPKTTAVYAHLVNRLSNRYTSAITTAAAPKNPRPPQ